MSKLAKALTAAAGNAGGESLYVEDVFSTYLYTGDGSTETITNGIDLDGEGGLTWFKARNEAQSHILIDSERGGNKTIFSNETRGEATQSWSVTYNSDGMTLPASAVDPTSGIVNFNTYVMSSWTFRKAEKFFDVVKWTGDGTASRQLSHGLNATPGLFIIKNLTAADPWIVWHKDLGDFSGAGKNLILNTTAAADTGNLVGTLAEQTSTYITVKKDVTKINYDGHEYIAYLFASDAGGFGDDGSESIIKCGSFTVPASSPYDTEVNLGFEPQWLLIKGASNSENWDIHDNMRGIAAGSNDNVLYANHASSEITGYDELTLTPTGFIANPNGLSPSATYIYIAIRRPMKTPESGTEVFSPVLYTGDGSSPKTVSGAGFAPDALWQLVRTGSAYSPRPYDKLRGTKQIMSFNSQSAEYTDNNVYSLTNDGAEFGSQNNNSGVNYASYFFKRAYSFFDVVCYTGDGASTKTITHGLGVTPELAIVKRRNVQDFWAVAHKDYLPSYNSVINSTNGFIYDASRYIQDLASSTFRVGTYDEVNASGSTYVAYLYATLAGVSKVGSYTGTGSNIDIDCGFSAGARFVLIKGGSGGNWYVWDSARGIIAGNDPYQVLNSSANDVTSTDYIDPLSSGFTVTSSAPADMNTNGQTYIFLAIA